MSIDQEAQFTLLLNDHIDKLNEKWRTAFTIDQETYDKIMFAVQLPKGEKCHDGNSFKFWSCKHFKIEKIGTKPVSLDKFA